MTTPPASETGSVRSVGGLVDIVDRWALFIAGLSLAWLVLLVEIPSHLNQDGWLALVAGREVSERGIPQHDRLTALTHGARWVDQQWLSQLAVYETYRIGGLALYCILYVGLAVAALALAVAAGRHLGGADLHVTIVLPIATVLFIAASSEVRTQGVAYPLFVAALWLLTAESRLPTWRGYLVFPLLVLWANLHGSVTLGVSLAVLHGLSLLLRPSSAGLGKRPFGRALVFIVGAPLCLLATPYGVDIVSYYQDTLGNSQFPKLVTEWHPVTSITLLAVPFFVVAFAAVWLLGRSRGRHGPFEHLALLLLITSGITAVRNVTWLGLAAIVLLPGVLGSGFGEPVERPRRRRFNVTIAMTSLASFAGVVAIVASKPAAWFERDYDPRVATVVARLMRDDPALGVFGGDRFSDWLLWHEPQLAGRVAYDSRLELLTGQQLQEVADYGSGNASKSADIVRHFGLVVVDTKRQVYARLRQRDARTKVVFRGHDVIVARRPQRGASHASAR